MNISLFQRVYLIFAYLTVVKSAFPKYKYNEYFYPVGMCMERNLECSLRKDEKVISSYKKPTICHVCCDSWFFWLVLSDGQSCYQCYPKSVIKNKLLRNLTFTLSDGYCVSTHCSSSILSIH